VEGLSTAEIAEVTGWSVSKVKVRAHRARAHLRRVLKRFV
jgi:DNA-directed RNA polymerase specialized sigma24 family protein